MNKTHKYLPILVTIFAILLLQACGGGGPNPGGPNFNSGPQATSVETITAEASDISQQIKSFGNIRAQEIVNVVPQVSNRITQIHSDLGDTVQPGDVLAEIYAVPFRDQFQQAKAQLEQSRAAYVRDSLQFQRQQELYKKELISSTEYDNARATFQNSKSQYEASRANLTQSRENLMNTEITSPVFGVVLTRNISEGDLATTGQTAYEIANLTGYQCRLYLPFEEWRNVKIGQPVDFRVSNNPGITGEGRVSQISPRLDPSTGLGEVVISLTEQGQNIYQGVLVQATINVETHENAVVIPRAALVENVQTLIEPESNTIQLERSYSVFVVHNDTLATRRELKLGIEQGDQIEILEGIQPGDEIVITGQNSLEDSTNVRIAGQQDLQGPEEIPIETSDGQQANQDTSSTSVN